MRLSLRLVGKTLDGRAVFLEASVYASSQKQFMDEAQKMASTGPWFYVGTAEAVPEASHITVEQVEEVQPKKGK
jgi:hypothetical protein